MADLSRHKGAELDRGVEAIVPKCPVDRVQASVRTDARAYVGRSMESEGAGVFGSVALGCEENQ